MIERVSLRKTDVKTLFPLCVAGYSTSDAELIERTHSLKPFETFILDPWNVRYNIVATGRIAALLDDDTYAVRAKACFLLGKVNATNQAAWSLAFV